MLKNFNSTASCPISGIDSTFVANKRGYRLFHNSKLDHYFVHPSPCINELIRYYSSSNSYGERWKLVDLNLTSPDLAISLDKQLKEEFGVKGVSFLDIGCGDGRLIFQMRKLGWEVSGIEYSDVYVNKCADYNLDVQMGGVREDLFPVESFDVIYLGDVIEHLTSPLDTVNILKKFLKPEGILILRTPNSIRGYSIISLLFAKFTKCQWFASEAPAHLNDFSMKSLYYLVEKSGFNVRFSNYYGYSSMPYCLGSTGYFDDIKPNFRKGDVFQKFKIMLRASPKLFLVSLGFLPCYYLGRCVDFFRKQKSQIFLAAQKV